MTREEIKKAIENGESVWYPKGRTIKQIDLKNTHLIFNGCQIDTMIEDENGWHTEFYGIKDLYKTKAEAEHYLHHANITRTEQLPFLTWEEFSKINIKDIEFTDKKLNLYNLSGFGKIKLYRNIDTADETLLLELEATEANFYKAYDECVKLFGQE